MDQFSEIRFIPTFESSNKRELLKKVGEMIGKCAGLGGGEERESSHYLEYTYIIWKGDPEIKLYWSDDFGMDKWLILTTELVDLSNIETLKSLKKCISENSKEYVVEE